MPESSPPLSENARKILAMLLRALAATGQNAVGEAIGRSESWVSRWKADEAEDMARIIDATGQKLVPASAVCVTPEYIEHLRYFARFGIANQPAPVLEWDDGGE